MATLLARQQAIDAYVEARLSPAVASLQASYRAAHGAYFQGVWTHDAPVPGGGASRPDLSRRPDASLKSNGLAHSWGEAGAAPLFPGNGAGAMDARVSVDEYSGSAGDGYVIRVQIDHNGEWWERCWAFGPLASVFPVGWIRADEVV